MSLLMTQASRPFVLDLAADKLWMIARVGDWATGKGGQAP